MDTLTWSLTEQSVPGHPELGLVKAQMVETPDGALFLMGGKDGHINEGYNWIFAYDEVFGFYDTGLKLPKRLKY